MMMDRSALFSFHRPLCTPIDRKQLRRSNLPPHIISSIANLNQHKFSLAARGIVPNQLRKLWSGIKNLDDRIEHFRKTFFLGGYKIWKARKRLISSFWKSKNLIEKKTKKDKKVNISNCKNAFHFLKKIADFSKQRINQMSMHARKTCKICSKI